MDKKSKKWAKYIIFICVLLGAGYLQQVEWERKSSDPDFVRSESHIFRWLSEHAEKVRTRLEAKLKRVRREQTLTKRHIECQGHSQRSLDECLTHRLETLVPDNETDEIDQFIGVGVFKSMERNGQGTVTYHNGNKYVGEWKDWKYNGSGTYYFSPPHLTKAETLFYERFEPAGWGEIPDDYITSDLRDKYVGEWKDGTLWNIILLHTDGDILKQWVNGVEQK